jgi:hypothetical protein
MHRNSSLAALALLMALALLPVEVAFAAKSKITISQAAWFPKTGQLRVKSANRSAVRTAELYDVNGRRLASATGAKLNFTLGADRLPTVPCAVRVQAGNDEALLAVKGAPKACTKAPTCSIITPSQETPLKMGVETRFQATASTKDKQALPLKYKWDFAGGSLGVNAGGTGPVTVHRQADTLSPTVSFVLDNTTFRVRFSATDAKGRRCEDAVNVAVGTPPTGLPAKVPEQSAPKMGSELDGAKDDLVVLPFEDWTMQADTDADFMPSLYNSMSPTIHNLKTVAYRKDRFRWSSPKMTPRSAIPPHPTPPTRSGPVPSTPPARTGR